MDSHTCAVLIAYQTHNYDFGFAVNNLQEEIVEIKLASP